MVPHHHDGVHGGVVVDLGDGQDQRALIVEQVRVDVGHRCVRLDLHDRIVGATTAREEVLGDDIVGNAERAVPLAAGDHYPVREVVGGRGEQARVHGQQSPRIGIGADHMAVGR